MPSKTASDKDGLTEDQIDRVLNQMADSFSQQLRSPILHSPSERTWITRMSLFCHWTTFPWRAGLFQPPAPTSSSSPITRWVSAGPEFPLTSNRGDRFGVRAGTTSK